MRGTGGALTALRRYTKAPAAEERCYLCSISLAPRHRHLVDIANRSIVCSCNACALLFQGAAGGRFKLIPRDPRALPDFRMTDAEWESFGLPISLAFFFFSTPLGKMTALYPSPAGATESQLPLETWSALMAENQLLKTIEPDVEALLVNRLSDARDYLIAPIDQCYELVGLIRIHWRGFSGGDEVWQQLQQFFTRLKDQCQPSEAGRA